MGAIERASERESKKQDYAYASERLSIEVVICRVFSVAVGLLHESYAHERLKAHMCVRTYAYCMAPYVLHCYSHG